MWVCLSPPAIYLGLAELIVIGDASGPTGVLHRWLDSVPLPAIMLADLWRTCISLLLFAVTGPLFAYPWSN